MVMHCQRSGSHLNTGGDDETVVAHVLLRSMSRYPLSCGLSALLTKPLLGQNYENMTLGGYRQDGLIMSTLSSRLGDEYRGMMYVGGLPSTRVSCIDGMNSGAP